MKVLIIGLCLLVLSGVSFGATKIEVWETYKYFHTKMYGSRHIDTESIECVKLTEIYYKNL